MIFELIKLTGGLLMPVPVILVLLVVGLVLVVAGRRRRLGIGFVAVGTVLLLVVSLPWLSERALRDLEQAYPVLREPPQAEWIVVLGGGSRDNESLPPASRLGESSMYRLAEGVRLAKLLPGARLVTSGGGSGAQQEASTAELMEKVAVDWGIASSRITTLTDPRNTEAEARAAAEIISEQAGVILVTSAFHMRRAKTLFEGQGLKVIPAPAGHLVDPQRGEKHIGHQLPQAKYIGFAETALWERIGMVWAWLRGAS